VVVVVEEVDHDFALLEEGRNSKFLVALDVGEEGKEEVEFEHPIVW
jgi:hypothetical protein